jgi:hypothetical protein
MARDHYPPLLDVTANTKKTAASIDDCWTVITEMKTGKAFIKSVTIYFFQMGLLLSLFWGV